MKGLRVLFFTVALIIMVGVGIEGSGCAGINALPAVAINTNDEVTITWGYLGLGGIPSILAKRYNAEGEPIDGVEFSVSSPFGAPSIFNYDPDIATDSANNSVIAWCSYEFSAPGEDIQVVYKKVSPASETTRHTGGVSTALFPQQDDGEVDSFTIPYSPVIAIDDSDKIAMAWCYYDVESGENGVYLMVVDSQGTAITPVKIVDNASEDTVSRLSPAGQTIRETAITPRATTLNPVFYHSPAIAIDGEDNIVVTWTATGVLPNIIGSEPFPLTAVFYSKYDTSGSVVSGYDKETVAIGFDSTVAVDPNGTMIIAWNTLDIVTLKMRIMASIYETGGGVSTLPFEVGVRSAFASTGFIDSGSNFYHTGIDAVADSEGNFFITWGGGDLVSNHIYLKEIYSGEYYLSNEIQVSQGFDANADPSVATDSKGNIVITWSKFSPEDLFTGAYSIYARRYDKNLQALGDEFKVNVSY